MISSFANVKTRVLNLLDDPNQGTFTDAVVLAGMGEAVDALYQAFVFFQIPRTKVITTYTLPAQTTNFTPATAGITDMGEVIELRERLAGSTERYVHVWEVDDLIQRDPQNSLGQWEWRGDSFWFTGATTNRDLQISYFSTTDQPTDFTGSTGTDGVLTFISKYAAGIIGPRKGYDELGAAYMTQAVGPRYNDGIIGGELFRVCQPMGRSRQRVQVAPKPYSVIRRRAIRRPPYIAAQQPAGAGMAPTQFSSTDGTLTGAIDGNNKQFLMPFAVSEVNVYLNGLLQTKGVDYTFAKSNAVNFVVAPSNTGVPDTILVEAWA